jgi:hypothetical protein
MSSRQFITKGEGLPFGGKIKVTGFAVKNRFLT